MSAPLRFLIGAGPTHEPIDPVRYLGNSATGLLGIELATEAAQRGHSVTLVLGPTHLQPPKGCVVMRVQTALEMLAALEQHFHHADVLLMTAAVADVRPARVARVKLKKEELGDALQLQKNPDIIAHLGRMRRQQVVVGFALETLRGAEAVAEAARKARAKCCDLVVLNSPGSLGGERAADVVFVRADGSSEELGGMTKVDLAKRLVAWCETAGRLQK
ncbi:MAG: phosphopantothenoylcysteine decarboxylase [Planctomycetes bacterium]|nr:phosphopantothenoylcysteine decarboxylase [Planctomycetota bacterium]